jgi:hypothetical protein
MCAINLLFQAHLPAATSPPDDGPTHIRSTNPSNSSHGYTTDLLTHAHSLCNCRPCHISRDILFYLINFVHSRTSELIIMSKHGSSDRNASGGKRQRKSVILEEKLDVIKSYVHNESTIRK